MGRSIVGYTKPISLIVAGLLLATSINPAFAAEDTKKDPAKDDSALTTEQSHAVMQNCSNVKQSLTQLQRVDSRTRAYLGTTYETIAGRFITPLNLRMVKNGLPSTELFRIQNEFTARQEEFRYNYVEYMRELEALIATDCSTHPQEFYDKLKVARTKREQLRQVTKQISNLASEQYKTVEELKATL